MNPFSSLKRFVSNNLNSSNLFGFNKKPKKDKKLIINNVNVRPIHRKSQDIQKWKNALQSAEGYTQQRSLLYDLYHDILLDGYLKDAIRKRIIRITNSKLTFTIDGKEVDEVNALTKKSFFADLLKFIMESKFWGHSLIEIPWAAPNSDTISETFLIPRKHVKPRFGLVTTEQYGIEGTKYREGDFMKQVIEVGDPEDLGEILEACQYVIYKRGNFGDWAEYAEIFGMPFRWATYNNEPTRKVLEEALDQAGSAGYVVAPEDAKLQFLQGNTQNGTTVFDPLRKGCNEEISICILGNSMTTTEASNSGYAQSKVQSDGQDELHKDDRTFLIRILNEKLTSVLERLGYKVKGGEWNYADEETISLKDRLEIDLKVSTKVPVPVSYWYEKYNIPVPTADDLPAAQPTDEEEEPDPDDSKEKPDKKSIQKKKLTASYEVVRRNELIQLHADHHDHDCMSLSDFNIRFAKIDSGVQNDFLNKFYSKQLGNNKLHADLFRNYYIRFIQYAEAGFSSSFYQPKTLEQFKAFESFKRNLAKFSAHKYQSLTSELSGLARLPLKDYLKEGKKLLKRYNQNYLKAELSVTSVSADSAMRWSDYQKRKSLYPNIEYVTAGDQLVRPSHAAMDGKVYPVDDPIWDTWFPPNGYLCRCTTVSSDDPVSDQPPADTFVDKGFEHNPGKSQIAFSDKHPYFKVSGYTSNRLQSQAEDLRSGFEAKVIMDFALKTFSGANLLLPGQRSKVIINKGNVNQVINSKHQKTATKNAMLTALNLIFPDLVLIKEKGKTLYFEYKLLDDIYVFKFYKSVGGLDLIGITDKL